MSVLYVGQKISQSDVVFEYNFTDYSGRTRKIRKKKNDQNNERSKEGPLNLSTQSPRKGGLHN